MSRRTYGIIWAVALSCVSVTALAQATAPSMTVTGSIAKPITLAAPLFGNNGAFRLVAARDKRGARSVRTLTKLEIVQLRK